MDEEVGHPRPELEQQYAKVNADLLAFRRLIFWRWRKVPKGCSPSWRSLLLHNIVIHEDTAVILSLSRYQTKLHLAQAKSLATLNSADQGGKE